MCTDCAPFGFSLRGLLGWLSGALRCCFGGLLQRCLAGWGFLVEVTFAEEKPGGGHAVVAGEVGEPCRLEDVALGRLLAGVEVPPVDAVAVGEGLLPADAPVGLEALECLEEPVDDGY